MTDASTLSGVLAKAKALYGLSRATQATLSLAQPATAALLAAGMPSVAQTAIGTVAALAGFYAVFAANDLIDIRLDRRGFDHVRSPAGPDIDSAGGRHPLAQGRLSLTVAVVWVTGLGLVALAGAATLSWISAGLFCVAAGLQVLYCALATKTCSKTIVSGAMVAAGAAAGWFAVTDEVDPLLGLVLLWIAAWEIGGRNIPNDLADVEEDVHLGIKTIPVVHGARASGLVAFSALLISALAGVGTMVVAFPATGMIGLTAFVIAAGFTLIAPGLRLMARPSPTTALAAFNRASFHPVLVFIGTGLAVWR